MKFLPLTDEDIGKIMARAREDAIEECARALEGYHRQHMMFGEDNGWFVDAIAAIRALKG